LLPQDACSYGRAFVHHHLLGGCGDDPSAARLSAASIGEVGEQVGRYTWLG
jgi:hypothetical protein